MLAAHICLCGSTNDKEPCALLIVINYTSLSHYMVIIGLVLTKLPLAVATVDQAVAVDSSNGKQVAAFVVRP